MRRITLTTLACSLLVASTGCDREVPEGQVQQNKRNDETQAYRTLLVRLKNAPSDADRTALLKKFIAEHPDHPDVPEAKKRLEALEPKENPADAIMKAAWDGDGKALVKTFALSQPARMRNQSKGPLAEPVELPTVEESTTFQKGILVAPARLRGAFQFMLQKHHPDGLDKPCKEDCLNDAVNNLVMPIVGAKLIEEPARINKDALSTLIDKGWLTPDDDIAGTAAKKFYTVFEPTVAMFVKTREVVNAAGVGDAAKSVAASTDPKTIEAFYEVWTTENKIAEKVQLDEKTTRNVVSWWIRREADGSAPVLDDLFARLQRDYGGKPTDAPAEPDEKPADEPQ